MEKQITLVEARNYLVKGCAPQEFREGDEFSIDQEGPVNQRRWQIADASKRIFRSQRHKGFGRLALVQPRLVGDTLILRAEGMQGCTVPASWRRNRRRIAVCGRSVFIVLTQQERRMSTTQSQSKHPEQ